jgi:dCTP deaminase
MILTGPEIHKRVRDGRIEIEPFREDQINPASYDLRMGMKMARYTSDKFFVKNEVNLFGPGETSVKGFRFLDSREEQAVQTIEMLERGDQLVLHPGILYLMHTEEIVCSHDCVSVIDGKSSLGRLGISCHQTAGYGDPGFRGQYTLEVTVVHPVIVYAGMRFCQIRFHEVTGEIQKYAGQYQGETAMGPVASRSWKQFSDEEGK